MVASDDWPVVAAVFLTTVALLVIIGCIACHFLERRIKSLENGTGGV